MHSQGSKPLSIQDFRSCKKQMETFLQPWWLAKSHQGSMSALSHGETTSMVYAQGTQTSSGATSEPKELLQLCGMDVSREVS